MVVMPRPVELLSGEMNRPSDWRAPIVTIKMPAADKVTTTADLLHVLIDALMPARVRQPGIEAPARSCRTAARWRAAPPRNGSIRRRHGGRESSRARPGRARPALHRPWL